ncbi:MAG: YfcE family phosphodiesterase [Phycisphaerae bacterium]|nr:YfcE family phosphodiesterase [Phycisphaerae bacterium]
MIVCLLADIHANEQALRAVLADAQRRSCEAIWNLGDSLGYGPRPEEVVHWQRTNPDVVSILGNYDRKVLSFARKPSEWPKPKSPAKFFAFRWAYEQLSEIHRVYLERLPAQARLEAGGHKILLVHASPEDESEAITEHTPPERLEHLANIAGADLVLFGHSHQPFDRSVHGVRFINPGSVGRSDDGDPRAAYATLHIERDRVDVEFHRVPYDYQAVAADARRRGLPEAFAQMFLRGCSLEATIAEGFPVTETNPNSSARNELLERAGQLAEACHFEERHARQVTRLALRLFDELQTLHCLGAESRLLLETAGVLHDIGWIEGQKKHHKVSYELILTAGQLPLHRRERMIVAGVARYHRKALPQPDHESYASLQAGDRNTVDLLAGMLRVADGLDRSHTDAIRDVTCECTPREIIIHARADGGAEEELQAAAKKSDLMEQAFRRKVKIEILERP